MRKKAYHKTHSNIPSKTDDKETELNIREYQ